MSLLPPCYLPTPWDDKGRSREPRMMDSDDTGLLRRGEDELAVAQLTVLGGGDSPELCVLRSRHLGLEWETERLLVVCADGVNWNEVNEWWHADAVVPIGDRFLCWADYNSGLMLCDVFNLDDDHAVIRYVPLPVEPNKERRHHEMLPYFKNARNIGATAGGAVRFVSIDRRYCCGVLLESSCPRSRSFFTLTTWTLDMDTMTWSVDGVLHHDELWTLAGYEGLPRVTPEFPILSVDDAGTVCLMVCHDKRIWMIEVDTRSKTLGSVVRYSSERYKPMDGREDDQEYQVLCQWINDESRDHFDNIGFIPSQVSKYLN